MDDTDSQIVNTRLAAEELERLRRFEKVVADFIGDRGEYVTALLNCGPDNTADYWRWQGHAEARRQLLASLPWAPDTDTAEVVSRKAGVTR
jgi:hypothetical protein